jgi:hypothetical protein
VRLTRNTKNTETECQQNLIRALKAKMRVKMKARKKARKKAKVKYQQVSLSKYRMKSILQLKN